MATAIEAEVDESCCGSGGKTVDIGRTARCWLRNGHLPILRHAIAAPTPLEGTVTTLQLIPTPVRDLAGVGLTNRETFRSAIGAVPAEDTQAWRRCPPWLYLKIARDLQHRGLR